MRRSLTGMLIAFLAVLSPTNSGCGKRMDAKEFQGFLSQHLAKVEPLEREMNIAYWQATISGKKEDFDRFAELQVRLQKIYSDSDDFRRVKAWHEGGRIRDQADRRQVDMLYRAYLRNQIDPELNEAITKLASEIENRFNVYRGKVDGKTVTSNEILDILKTSTDSELRKKAWEAGKGVGQVVASDLIRLVKMRNQAARALGYPNYYAMALDLGEQNEKEILSLFEELDELTREPYVKMKREVDSLLALRYGMEPEDLRPWHYEDPFFQEAPQVYTVNLDYYYKGRDILDLVKNFYAGIGLIVDDILTRSDLYEKPGKEQHAYCTDIDRKGDIRILANIKDDETWTGTMLHELGHAVYDKYIDPSLPYLLRTEAHTFTTEAIAMLFGRLSKDASWIQEMVGISDEERVKIEKDVSKSLRLAQLIFARWCQVMVHFERQLYADPEQDLNRLWWDLVRRYQMVTPPEGRNEPDWGAKIHIVSAPVYYHNYMLGELLASQLNHYIETEVLGAAGGRIPYAGHPEVGAYLKERVFSVGALYRWDEMIERATGEKLNPRYFVEQFVEPARL